MRTTLGLIALFGLLGCGGNDPGSVGEYETGDTSATESTESDSGQETGDGTDTGMPKLDVGPDDETGTDTDGGDICKVGDEMDGILPCTDKAPPDSFTPDQQWEWTGPNGFVYSVIVPMVGNLTDDNDDGEIDLCDTPDVVVLAYHETTTSQGRIWVLDGETGTEHFTIPTILHSTIGIALGDVNLDGLPDIVAVDLDGLNLIAFDHEGTELWQSAMSVNVTKWASLAIADMDNDGKPEIIAGNMIFGNDGAHLRTVSGDAGYAPTPTAADLDGDEDLELVLGASAYNLDGSQEYATGLEPGFPAVGNFDGDEDPEVLLANVNGLSMMNHDGSIIFQNQTPTGDAAQGLTWLRPATIHDFDGDGQSEFATSSSDHYTVYEPDAQILWSSIVSDQTGGAAGTAFDFLGDGIAEAMYADENDLFIFDGLGGVLLQAPRTSYTGSEYPVVADIDNDQSAEILVVSNESLYGDPPGATIQAIRDAEDRWVQARRIWNQHTYHVTNVREDGTIPQYEKPNWETLNTFRTNAQIDGEGVCKPDPEG
jgi:hypothetical protein